MTDRPVSVTSQALVTVQYAEGAKKKYTHFKKGEKNCIKIVILNIYR